MIFQRQLLGIYIIGIIVFSSVLGCKKDPDLKPIIEEPKIPVTEQWQIPVLAPLDAEFEQIFNTEGVLEIHLSFTLDEWNALLNDYDKHPRNEMYREAACIISGNGINKSYTSVGIKLRGNINRKRPEEGSGPHNPGNKLNRMHYKIKFSHDFSDDESAYGYPSKNVPDRPSNKLQQLTGYCKAINLKYNNADPTYVREAVSYELFRKAGVQVVHTTFARLYIKIGSEQDRYIGVMLAMEDIDKSWIRKRFNGYESSLVKCLYQGYGPADLAKPDWDNNNSAGRVGSELTDPTDSIHFKSGFKSYRPSYDIKEDPGLTAAAEINKLMAMFGAAVTSDDLNNALDVQTLLRAQAMNVLVGMADDYWRGGNNYYMYQNPLINNKWTFMPYDYDRTFGTNTFGPETATSSVVTWGANSGTPCNPVLINKTLAKTEFLNDYKAYLLYYLDNDIYTDQQVVNRMMYLQSIIQPYTTGYQANDDYPFQSDLSDIRTYIQKRVEVVNRECRPVE